MRWSVSASRLIAYSQEARQRFTLEFTQASSQVTAEAFVALLVEEGQVLKVFTRVLSSRLTTALLQSSASVTGPPGTFAGACRRALWRP